MLALWTVFALMLFVIEPLFLHKRMAVNRKLHKPTSYAWWLCIGSYPFIAVVTVFGAMGGAHGLF